MLVRNGKDKMRQSSQLLSISTIAPNFGQDRFNLDDLKLIAKKEKIIYWERNLPCKGIFVVGENNKYIIINSKLNNFEKEFTFAHELAHYFLNHDKDIFYGIISGSQAEFEANLIALIFLLPDRGMKIELPKWEAYFGGERDLFFYEYGVDILVELRDIWVNFRTKVEMTPLKPPESEAVLKENLELVRYRKKYVDGVIKCKLWLIQLANFFPKKN